MSLPATVEKLESKLRVKQRKEKRRLARLAAMSPERRARYDKWVRTHAPGSGAARAAKRAEARDNDYFRRLFASEPSQVRQSIKAALISDTAEARIQLGATGRQPVPKLDGEDQGGIFS